MILYLYALADRVARLDEIAGVGAEPLLQIDTPAARLLAGWLDAAPVIDRAALEAQDRVIRALHDRADALLPMRFGTTADSIDAAIGAVEIISRSLPERFDLVRGREQMTVRVLRPRGAKSAWSASGAWGAGAKGARGAEGAQGARGAQGAQGARGAQGAGTTYLRARALADVPVEIQPLLDALAPLPRATKIERAAHDAIVATVYHLIDRGRSAEYHERVERIAATQPDLTLRVSGPSPVFAFARE